MPIEATNTSCDRDKAHKTTLKSSDVPNRPESAFPKTKTNCLDVHMTTQTSIGTRTVGRPPQHPINLTPIRPETLNG